MLLGDVIAKFDDPAFASETLIELGDLSLLAQVIVAASASNMSAGEFAAQSVGRFADGASDEDWLTLIGLMSRADNPARAFLSLCLSKAVRQPHQTHAPTW